METITLRTNVEAEQAVVSLMLVSYSSRETATVLLDAVDFTNPQLMKIFAKIKDLHAKSSALEWLLVYTYLKGESGITQELLQNLAIASQNVGEIETWCLELKKSTMDRKYRMDCHEGLHSKEPIEELIESHKKKLNGLSPLAKREVLSISAVLQDFKKGKSFKDHVSDGMRAVADGETILDGISWGYYFLDKITSGLCRGHLIICGARPGVGKTTFALNVARRLLIQDVPVMFISYEMNEMELVTKLLCCHAKIDSQMLRQGLLSQHEYSELIEKSEDLGEKPFYMIDDSSLTISQLIITVQRSVKDLGIQAVFIDYLGLIRSNIKYENKNQEVAYVSRELKLLAKKCDIPIICLSQLSRRLENEKRRPQVSDLRDSGQIEADADLVLLLHKPEDKPAMLEIDIRKNRLGPQTILEFCFEESLSRISEIGEKK